MRWTVQHKGTQGWGCHQAQVGRRHSGSQKGLHEHRILCLKFHLNFNTYEWTNSVGESLSNSSSFTYTPEKSDWYNLYVTNGICKGYCSIYITLGVIPVDAISPNGDGYNDTWYIQDLERYPNATVKVFNRWGQLLLESDGPSYPNNDFDWTELPVGTYYYIIDLGNGDSPQTGPITIIK